MNKEVEISNKDLGFIYEIIKCHPYTTVNSVMKLAYLIDLLAVKKLGKQISSLRYKLYSYGPCTVDMYDLVSQLTEKEYIKSEIYFNADNDYSLIRNNDKMDIQEKEELSQTLSKEEVELIQYVCNNLRDLSAKQLTEVAYKTEPMKKLSATLGGNENLNKPLNLKS